MRYRWTYRIPQQADRQVTLAGNTYTAGPVTADCSVSTSFTSTGATTWTISATATALPATAAPVTGGRVQGAGSYADGAPVTLLAVPDSGFAFVGWEENGATVARTARYAFTANADRSLTAHFSIAQPLLGDMNDASATRAMALGDLNGDGHTDLVVVNGADRINGPVPSRIWFGNGAGGFVDSGQALPGGGNVADLALDNLDGDGALDLALASQTTGAIVLHNDGKGNFGLPGTGYKTTNARTTTAVALGDVDVDGDLDLVVGNAAEVNTVWLNDGQGTFTDSGQRLGGFNLPFTASVALGDLNRDGLPDLVFGNLAFNNTIWVNAGQGQFINTNQTIGAVDATTAVVGDIDGDNDLDLVAGHDGPDSLWINDGQGNFRQAAHIHAESMSQTRELVFADLDGDGDPDLATANLDGGIAIRRNVVNP